ncbi:MAG TPA: ABC transporter ATP-binding protein [Thioalkalivibrio sp.]|nr:ABC transporter ATP-binding protein [Thioalkalivibrio sp.]
MSLQIKVVGVRKAFNEDRPNRFWAVDGVNLSLSEGQVTVLAGPSGSDKTTLLTLVGCLARPTEGRVLLNDRVISSLPEPFLAALRRQTFGFVFQRFNLIRGLSLLDNVMVPAYPLGMPRGALRKRALELLDTLGLEQRAHARVESLSGGEAQRTALARAMINDPPVLIADEPTANLDSELSLAFLEILARLRAEGRTLLLSSHDPLVREAAVVDRIIELRDGRVVTDQARPGGFA